MFQASTFDKARSSQYKDDSVFLHKTPTSVRNNIISAIPVQQTPTQFSGSTTNRVVVHHKIKAEERVTQSFNHESEPPSERQSQQLVATQRVATFATSLNFASKYEPFDPRDEDLVVLKES